MAKTTTKIIKPPPKRKRNIAPASSGAFWWADRIEAKSVACYILDPHKFRVIKDSWKKTDKYDSRNMVKAL